MILFQLLFGDYVSDKNGNRCYFDHFGSPVAALKALRSLKNCRDCVDCRDCTNCVKCFTSTRCHDCKQCDFCDRCYSCNKIQMCEGSMIVGPTRSDGYQFVMSESGSIHAGCRILSSIDKARQFWEERRGKTPLGNETQFILNQLEIVSKARRAT
jgi:hypothetical protein